MRTKPVKATAWVVGHGDGTVTLTVVSTNNIRHSIALDLDYARVLLLRLEREIEMSEKMTRIVHPDWT